MDKKKGSYIALYHSGELCDRIRKAQILVMSCELCPHRCRVNRLNNEKGFCKTGKDAQVSRACVHRGEEPPISGMCGSGTIFFSHCNMACLYCQNYEISQGIDGESVTPEALGAMMITLQEKGCHNINLVSPSHVAPNILEALWYACEKGLHIPLVYNSNAYDSVSMLQLLEGVVDIYLPDLKYFSNQIAEQISKCTHYWETASAAIKEMIRQVGVLKCNTEGIAEQGVLIRHLVLPYNLSGSHDVVRFISEELPRDIWVSIMAQYYPCYHAGEHPHLCRKLQCHEYETIISEVERLELPNVLYQELESAEHYLPDFTQLHPFEKDKDGER